MNTLSFNFNPFPVIHTDRLVLRQMTENDAYEIYELRSLVSNNQYLNRLKCTNLLEAKQFIEKINAGIVQNEWIYWAVSFHSLPGLIGTICLWNFDQTANTAEMGVEILPEYQGKGLMTESLGAVIEYGMGKMNLNAILGYTHQANLASRKLMEKLGFDFSGEKIETHVETGEELKMIIYQYSNS